MAYKARLGLYGQYSPLTVAISPSGATHPRTYARGGELEIGDCP